MERELLLKSRASDSHSESTCIEIQVRFWKVQLNSLQRLVPPTLVAIWNRSQGTFEYRTIFNFSCSLNRFVIRIIHSGFRNTTRFYKNVYCWCWHAKHYIQTCVCYFFQWYEYIPGSDFPFVSKLHDHTHLDTLHSVGLLWTSDQPDAETSTWQHTTLKRDRHPCSRRDSNPQSQQANSRKPMP
jgi:hypothetical protein